MRCLIIKTSSLGDVINTLPALTDAANHFPDITFDWVVEPAFAEVPAWHPAVQRVIPFAFRRLRKNIIQNFMNKNWQTFFHDLRKEKYDLIIDAQGLIKSGLVTAFARGTKCGYDKNSAWEPLACLFYNKKYSVDPNQHAITRIRQLFAQSCDYTNPTSTADCNIQKTFNENIPSIQQKQYCVFLHGTARDEKLWPEQSWHQLIHLMKACGYHIYLPWGNNTEKNRAEILAQNQSHVDVLPKCTLTELANILHFSSGNVAVDTGLGHLAAALNSPTISLYGPTQPELNGATGKHQIHIKKPTLSDITPEEVFEILVSQVKSKEKM